MTFFAISDFKKVWKNITEMIFRYSNACTNQSRVHRYAVKFSANPGIELKCSTCTYFLSISTYNCVNFRLIIVSSGNFSQFLAHSVHYHTHLLILILD